MDKNTILWIMGLLVPAASASAQPITAPQTPLREGPRLRIQLNPLLNLFYTVSHAVDNPEEQPAIKGFDRAVEVVRELESQRLLGMRNYLRYWNLAMPHIEGELTAYNTAAEALGGFRELPVEFELTTGRKVALREGALRLAEALSVIEQEYLQTLWPEHRAALRSALASIEKNLLPEQGEIFAFLASTLRMEAPPETIPVYLTFRGASGKGMYGPGGKAVCFVRIEHQENRRTRHRLEPIHGSRWLEVVVHEAIHALDMGTLSSENTVPVEVRRRLREKETDADALWHFLLRVQAHEAIRRFVDPKHQLESHSNFEDRIESLKSLQPWLDYLDGKISRSMAIDAIVQRGWPG